MTNFEKWVYDIECKYEDTILIKTKWLTDNKMTKTGIVCLNSKCEECPIYKKFRVCECGEEVEKWLESEVTENDKN